MNLQKMLLAAFALLMAGQAWGTEALGDAERKKMRSAGEVFHAAMQDKLRSPDQAFIAYNNAIELGDEMALHYLIPETSIPFKLRAAAQGETLLTLAAKKGLSTNNFRILRQLLFFGAQANVANHKGETIFSIARNAQNAELQQCLKLRDNKKALYEQGQRVACDQLRELDIELTLPECAEILGDSETFNQKIEQAQKTGIDLPNFVASCISIWLPCRRYKFPEHLTVKQKDICRLIERIQQKGGSMQVPLALAISADDPVMIDLCCIRGAQLDQQIDKTGTMPLMGAIMRGASDPVIRQLILLKADPNYRNSKSETVIDVLRQKDRKKIAQWLTTLDMNNLGLDVRDNINNEDLRLAYKEAAFRIIQLHFPQADPARVLFDEDLFFAKLFKGGRLDNLVDSCMHVYKIAQLDKPAQIKKLKKWLDNVNPRSYEYLHLLMLRHRAGEDVAGPLDYDESGISVAHYAASKKNDSPLYTVMLKSLNNAITQQDTERSVADARKKEKMAEELAVPDSSAAAAAAPVEGPKKPSRKQLIQERRKKEAVKETKRKADAEARRKEESDAARAINEEAASRDAREYEAGLQAAREELEKRDGEIFKEVQQSLSDIVARVAHDEQERIEREERIRKERERKIQEQAEQEKNKAIARALSSIVNSAVQAEQQAAERQAKEEAEREYDDWIFEAIACGNLAGVKACIERHKVDINTCGKLGRKDTPLHAAVNAQQPAIVEYLLSKGADFRKVNGIERTPAALAEELYKNNRSENGETVLRCFAFKDILPLSYIEKVIHRVKQAQTQRAVEADASAAAKSS